MAESDGEVKENNINHVCAELSAGASHAGSRNGDLNQPESTCGSLSASAAPLSRLSLEERMKRIRAAEEIRQQQRYAACLESQRLAEMGRQKAQEERRRKIEEMRERAEARRACVLERRRKQELIEQAKMESLHGSRRYTVPQPGRSIRTASASPAFGTTRHPNQLMTTSCVVAFGSTVPRSACTHPVSNASHLQQKALQNRLASFLEGRHCGCFLTKTAMAHYMHYLDPAHLNSNNIPSVRALMGKLSSRQSKNHRRAISAHASLMQPTRSSLARSRKNRDTGAVEISEGVGGPLDGDNKQRSLAPNTTTDSSLISASQDRLKFQRPTRTATSSFNSYRAMTRSVTDNRIPSDSCGPGSANDSERSMPVNSSSSLKRGTIPSVFERLSVRRPRAHSGGDSNPTSYSSAIQKKTTNPSHPATFKRPTGPPASRPPKSVSVPSDRPQRKPSQTKPGVRKKRTVPAVSDTTTDVLAEAKPDAPSIEQSSEVIDEEIPSSASSTKMDEPSTFPSEELPSLVTDYCVSDVLLTPPEKPIDMQTRSETERITETEPSTTPIMDSGPIQTETHGAGEGTLLDESQAAIYRAKLAEQRRLAREKKEREERERLEKEDEQRRLEEERTQLRLEEERQRVAAERAAKVEEARLAEDAAETQRQKEEDEKRERLRALESERLAKLQRAEEERSMRKKRLESVMSRFKSSSTNSITDGSQPTIAVSSTNKSDVLDPLPPPPNFLDKQPNIEGFPSTTTSPEKYRPINGHSIATIVNGTNDLHIYDTDDMVTNEPPKHTSSTFLGLNHVNRDLNSFPSSPTKTAVADNPPAFNASTPQFKSTLLQSMVNQGKLPARVAAGLRRGSGSQLSDGPPSCANSSGGDSPQWPQVDARGDSAVADNHVITSTAAGRTTADPVLFTLENPSSDHQTLNGSILDPDQSTLNLSKFDSMFTPVPVPDVTQSSNHDRSVCVENDLSHPSPLSTSTQ